jgi:hypothetical protein
MLHSTLRKGLDNSWLFYRQRQSISREERFEKNVGEERFA